MTGSVAPWLAHQNPRVRAVVSGGFASSSSYAGLLPYITANRAETQLDPVRWVEMTRNFDPDAEVLLHDLLEPDGAIVFAVRHLVAAVGPGDRRQDLRVCTRIVVGSEAAVVRVA